jgi:hypothetical protein
MSSISEQRAIARESTHAANARRPWWRSPLIWVLAASLAVFYGFTHFASEVLERETTAFDGAVREWVMTHRPPALVTAFGAITQLGDTVGERIHNSALRAFTRADRY